MPARACPAWNRGPPRTSGPGPWGSLLPALPSVPSQAIEGAATLAILAVLTVVLIAGAFGRRDGSLFFTAIGLWAVARALVSTTWRDPVVTGNLNAAGLIAVAIAVTCAVALVVLDRPAPPDGRPRRSRRPTAGSRSAGPIRRPARGSEDRDDRPAGTRRGVS